MRVVVLLLRRVCAQIFFSLPALRYHGRVSGISLPCCYPRRQARSLLREAQAKKKISEAEAKEIENDLRFDINTQFGTRNENDAIAVYERRSGTEVRNAGMEGPCTHLLLIMSRWAMIYLSDLSTDRSFSTSSAVVVGCAVSAL